MKTIYINKLFAVFFLFGLIACGSSENQENNHGHDHDGEESHGEMAEKKNHEEDKGVHFSITQFNALEIKIDTIPQRSVAAYVETNGQLEVPPQNEASVTAIIGANISSIKVIEGDKVEKGQVLAYINHPELIQLQSNYNSNWNELQYLELEFNRQQKLYDEKVGSGKELQRIKSDYQSKKSLVNGLAAQLKLLGISTTSVKNGKIIEQIAVRSPIEGYVRLVEIKTGQYVTPQTELFEIVNLEHIHADFMVFEKDIAKVQEGQKIRFKVESIEKELNASVYSVGKNFEQNPKAIHIHAEIENKSGLLLPGMYVRGKILTADSMGMALPEAAVIRDNGKDYIFSAKKESEDEWEFTPIEVIAGLTSDGWTEIKPLEVIPKSTKVAWNNAYYILAEMQKGEAEHSH
ncbi:efflux RND transporter periplasmic adaptor subunit [Acidiluteibacter ferrifornacis]|uniref:Efflux RND transporter periplasmic adaptor subunit n=1 Tax=Acidiluteibacter ferrifornacis TaxID=2692424 RepID=A0A6N9NJR3_9FLAO|nr:efflux RND transporter periplasmic adaptor subunit [Acidiluteibacter ferrifornacis]NBG65721.1 efflux RND transporter periplasmic adaptor subunit [Acidiluteibacter ferrifornacis]